MKSTYIPQGYADSSLMKQSHQAATLSATISKVELQADYNNKNMINSIPVGGNKDHLSSTCYSGFHATPQNGIITETDYKRKSDLNKYYKKRLLQSNHNLGLSKTKIISDKRIEFSEKPSEAPLNNKLNEEFKEKIER